MNKKNKKSKLSWIFLSVFLVLLLAGGAAAFHLTQNVDTFGENIFIDTVQVSDMTVEQATQAVTECLQEQVKAEWVFQHEGDIFPVEAAQVIFMPENVGEIIQKVWDEIGDVPLWKKLVQRGKEEKQEYPIEIEYNAEVLQQFAQQWHEKWNKEPVNATLAFSGSSLSVVPDQDGYVVHEQEVFDQLPVYYSEIQDFTMEIPVQVQKASVTADSWQNIGKLSSYSTNYNPGEVNRTHNMSLAVGKINGSVLYPGEQLSFNQTVGVRSAAAGYKDAKVISNGAYTPELGGGICQVTSTLYNGVLLAGLEIVERHNHALDVSYVPSGRDATVYYGSQDFRFKNSNQSPIYIGMSIGGGTVNVTIYGNTDEKKNISISTVLDKTIDYPVQYEEDDTLTEEKVIQGGMNGKVVRSFRNYLDANGNVIQQEALGQSYYQPLPRIIARPSENAQNNEETTETETGSENIAAPTESTEDPVQEPAAEIPQESIPSETFDPSVDPFGDVMP